MIESSLPFQSLNRSDIHNYHHLVILYDEVIYLKDKKYDLVWYFLCIFLVLLSCVIGNSHRLLSNINNDCGDTVGVVAEDCKIPPVVILDAGHGGEDPGAVGVDGTLEKDINLIISYKIADYLRLSGIKTVMTRTDDRLLYDPSVNVKGKKKLYDLKNRYLISCQYENSVFVSIHMNKYTDSKYKGLQVYYSSNDISSADLASQIQEIVREYLQNENNRQIKEGNGIYLLERISTPAVLVECGFLSNSEDCHNLCDDEYTSKIAFLISYAIMKNIC